MWGPEQRGGGDKCFWRCFFIWCPPLPLYSSLPTDTYTFNTPTLSCARGPFCTLWIFYTNTILQMSEWESIKTLALWFYFSPPEKKVQERVFFYSRFPLSVSSSISPLSAALSLSIPCFILFHLFIFNSQSFSEKKSEWEWGRKAERNPEIADGSGIFFSCSYPSAFEPAMWKSARSTALHSSLPLIKSRQSGLNQHAKCHSTL